MLAQARDRSAHGFGLPCHVERTFHRYLECGVLAHGFCRARCSDCAFDTVLPFSCKLRGLCPSCDGRRAADTAADLVDCVLPWAPYRMWTLSFPRVVRFALARSPKLLSQVVRGFVRVVFADLRRRARARGVSGQPGAVVFVQRFGSYANLNVHLHVCFTDGVFAKADDDRIRFRALAPPTDGDVDLVARKTVRRIAKLLERHQADAESYDLDDAFAAAQAAAVSAVPAANSDRGLPGQRPPRFRSAFLDGFSLDADVAIHRNDREGLERVLRYSGRPALASDRLAVDDHGRVTYRLRRPTASGKRELTIEPVDSLARLATLIPPPRQNQVRYFGGSRVTTAFVPGSCQARRTTQPDDPHPLPRWPRR